MTHTQVLIVQEGWLMAYISIINVRSKNINKIKNLAPWYRNISVSTFWDNITYNIYEKIVRTKYGL